ncbi:P-loop containing nucleoside triphosphate hydrolase protein [Mycena leptocephala]|nr:P-loop containing nucleoside triphosphate hydrolase protein [Mycena leptocephala]
MSASAFNAFGTLPPSFMTSLTAAQHLIVLEAFLYLDFASKGTKTPRELQLRANLAVKAGKDLLVRSGTGSGKTLAMILPVLSLSKDSVVITVSPLRLIQDNHVAEFSKYGISSIAINCFTPDDPELWKSITSHSKYQHYSVSPEQCGPYKGHIPRFAKLLHQPKWVKRVKLLQIDEAHFIATTGQSNGTEAAFRPSFSDLGERLHVHLQATTPCTAYSASMTPQIMELLTRTLRMDPEKMIKLELTTNRPNLVHAVIPMVGSIDNFSNVDFLIPVPFDPNVRRPKSMVFLDNKKKAAKLARHLNSKLPPAIAQKEPFRHYHSSMSKVYLEEIASRFKDPNGDVRCLIATEAASNGFDVPDISLIVQFGVPKSMTDGDQRGGRGGRDGRECLVLTIAERWAYDNIARTNTSHTPSDKEKRTEPAVISFASSKACRRRTLAKHNNDATPLAHDWSGKWCCDNHADGFDVTEYLVGELLTEGQESQPEVKVKKPRRKYRPVAKRQPIIDELKEWCTSTHSKDPVARNFPISYILDDSSMALLAREPPRSFRIPSEITTFLEETPEWHSRYALDVVTIIQRNDLNLPRANSISSSGTSSNSDSENSRDYSDSHKSDSDEDEIPAPTEDDQNTVIPSTSMHSSPTSSRTNSPEPALVSSTGRPLRRSALNHRVPGIAENMANKRQKV